MLYLLPVVNVLKFRLKKLTLIKIMDTQKIGSIIHIPTLIAR